MNNIQIQFLTKDGVSIMTQPDNHMKAYDNSEVGRVELLAEVDDADIISQVMAEWGGEPTVFPEPPPEPDVEAVRKAKLAEMADVCERTIYAGTDAPTSKGMEHFSLTIEDQKNMLAQTGVAGIGKCVLYHADGKPCRLFEPEEFKTVSDIAFAYITYSTTLCNFYNTWIRRSESIDELKEIVWGVPLPHGLTNEDGYTFNGLMEMMGIPFRAPIGGVNGGGEGE